MWRRAMAFPLHKPDCREVERMRKIISAMLVTTALAAPMAMTTSARAAEPGANWNVSVRVYDPYRHDRHVWDDREERSYRAYLAERHRSYLSYERQRYEQRRAYWRWRHEREHSRRW
jgi:hypothetical protein